jgi:hypothetical protein
VMFDCPAQRFEILDTHLYGISSEKEDKDSSFEAKHSRSSALLPVFRHSEVCSD